VVATSLIVVQYNLSHFHSGYYDTYEDGDVVEEERGEEHQGVKTRSMIKRGKEEQVKKIFDERLMRGRLKALEEEIIRINCRK